MEEEKKKLVALTRPVREEEVVDIYTNSAKLVVTQYEFFLQFGLTTPPDEEDKSLVNIRMSPQHAKVLTAILRKHLKKYEQDIGKINILEQIVKDLDIGEEI